MFRLVKYFGPVIPTHAIDQLSKRWLVFKTTVTNAVVVGKQITGMADTTDSHYTKSD